MCTIYAAIYSQNKQPLSYFAQELCVILDYTVRKAEK